MQRILGHMVVVLVVEVEVEVEVEEVEVEVEVEVVADGVVDVVEALLLLLPMLLQQF